ncbi:hypothetical protein B0H14DRAFT_2562278 [Mycena olivaceomarginata]|nr:hypothetical protein B0H14DRAFT_2562278 [Mycena olivaceomarginata]
MTEWSGERSAINLLPSCIQLMGGRLGHCSNMKVDQATIGTAEGEIAWRVRMSCHRIGGHGEQRMDGEVSNFDSELSVGRAFGVVGTELALEAAPIHVDCEREVKSRPLQSWAKEEMNEDRRPQDGAQVVAGSPALIASTTATESGDSNCQERNSSLRIRSKYASGDSDFFHKCDGRDLSRASLLTPRSPSRTEEAFAGSRECSKIAAAKAFMIHGRPNIRQGRGSGQGLCRNVEATDIEL